MKIPGILTDVTTKGVVVETSQIKDIPQNKTQEQINADIEDVEGDIIELQQSVQNHGARLNTAETKISTLETNVNNLDGWLDDIASDVSDHTTRLGAAESNITTLQGNVGSISSDVVEIKRKIPAAATASNQLADKDFVNSSIATATATFRGAYRLYDDLGLRVTGNTYDKPSCAFTLKTVISSEDNNDYCFVLIPTENTEGAATQYVDRYKYNGTDWSYEYTLNNSGFTAEQWAAINSGITSTIVEQIDDLPFERGTGTNSVKLGGDSTTVASGEGAVTFGRNRSTAAGIRSFSHGDNTFANANFSHAEGQATQASGESSHAEGFHTVASAQYSHAEGSGTQANNTGDHAEGDVTVANGGYSHAEGFGSKAFSTYSHAEGAGTEARAYGSHAEGKDTKALNAHSHAEGEKTEVNGQGSHAEGWETIAYNGWAHAEGYKSVTRGAYSHSEGNKTTTFGSGSHAEGAGSFQYLGSVSVVNSTTVFTLDETAQVYKGDVVCDQYVTKKAVVTEDSSNGIIHVDNHTFTVSTAIYVLRGFAAGECAHSEGKDTKASGDYSHAEGNMTYTEGQYSHAEGIHTQAANTGEHAAGKYNKSNQGTIHSVGVGTSVDDRKNAWEIDESGNVYIKDIGGYDGTNPSASTSLQTEYAANKGKVDLMFPSAPYVDGGNYPFEYNITTADDRYIYAYIDASSLYAYLENNAPATLNVNFKGVDYTLPVAKDTTDNHWYIGENISSVSDILSTHPITIIAFPTGGSDSFIKIKDEEGTALTEYFIGVGDFIENIHKVQDKFLPDTLVHSSHIDKIIVLSQAEFNALTSYEPNTQYEIYA